MRCQFCNDIFADYAASSNKLKFIGAKFVIAHFSKSKGPSEDIKATFARVIHSS